MSLPPHLRFAIFGQLRMFYFEQQLFTRRKYDG